MIINIKVYSYCKPLLKNNFYLGLFPFLGNSHDGTTSEETTTIGDKFEKIINIFREKDGYTTAEYRTIKEIVFYSTFAAFLLGGRQRMKIASDHFIRTSVLKGFLTRHEYTRRYMDNCSVGFLLGGVIAGVKTYILSNIVATTFICLPEIKGKNPSPIDFSIVGFIAGMAYNFHSGPFPMIRGGVYGISVGAALGTLAWATGADISSVVNEQKNKLRGDKYRSGLLESGKAEEEILGLVKRDQSK